MSAGYPFRRWSVASSRTVLANRVLKVRLDTCVIPAGGGALEYFVLELADWVNVVPVTLARELVMVRLCEFEQFHAGMPASKWGKFPTRSSTSIAPYYRASIRARRAREPRCDRRHV
jgi:hypothetical protein